MHGDLSMDAPSSVLGKRDRPALEGVETLVGSQGRQDRRFRGDALRVASVADLQVVKEHAQWRNPELKPQVDATQSSVVEGVDGAVSAWVAEECNRVLSRESSSGEEDMYADPALDAWGKFEVFGPFQERGVSEMGPLLGDVGGQQES